MSVSRFVFIPVLMAGFATLSAQAPVPADPDLKERAGRYLEMAGGMASAAPPESQPAILLQLGLVEAALDPAKALERLEQAFAAASVLPSRKEYRVREEMQALIAAEIAKRDLEKGLEKLASTAPPGPDEPDPRVEPIEQIVGRLVQDKKLDAAMEVIDRFSVGGAYPYRAARGLLRALPDEDNRLPLLFGQAISAFQQQPDQSAMESFVREFQPGKPKAMSDAVFAAAVRAMVSSALDKKGITIGGSMTMTTDKGTISLPDPVDATLFRIVDLAQRADPGLVRKMTADRPALVQVLERYPQGMRSLDIGDGVTTVGTVIGGDPNSPANRERQQRLIVETMKFQEVMVNYRKDPSKALEAARAIPAPVLRVRAIGTVAGNVDENDPAAAKSTLEKAIAALEEVKEANFRANGWSSIMRGAGRIHDKDLVVRAVTKGIEDAKVLYQTDVNPDNPNRAPRPMWPSTAVYKALFFQAARLLGADAEALLEKIPDAEVQSLARIEMAAAWLGTTSTPVPVRNQRAN
jgi:hypothetical protein